MLIGLKNSYFSQNLHLDAAQEFRQARPEDREAVISDKMSCWETFKDCFSSGCQRKALGYLFDMVQAEKANDDVNLSFEQRTGNRENAKAAFKELETLAYSKFEFIQTVNQDHQLSFLVADSTDNDAVMRLPVQFDYFDAEVALGAWHKIKGAIQPVSDSAAIVAVNQLHNASHTCDKIRHFVSLIDLAWPEDQKKFKIDVAPGFASKAKLTLSFDGEVLFRDLVCAQSEIEDIALSLLQYKGTMCAVQEEPNIDFVTARMFVSLGQLRGKFFSEQSRPAAAALFKKMTDTGVTAADLDRACSQLVQLDHRFKTMQFMFNRKYEITNREQHSQITRKATLLQSLVRKYLTVGTKESVNAMVPALKDRTSHKVIAYRIPQGDGLRKWVAFPPALPPGSTLAEGSSKALTNMNERYVGLTLRAPYTDSDGDVIDPIKPDKTFVTFNEKIAGFIDKNKLDCIVLQYRINNKQLISKNLGPKDLFTQAQSRDFVFDPAAFLRLFTQFDTLHAAKIVHRDIKPENMILFEGHARIFDNETMAETGKLKEGFNVSTTAYLHPDLRHGFYNEHSGVQYGVMVDRYALISTMIFAFYYGRRAENGVYHPKNIEQFLSWLPCSENKKIAIENFLLNPIKYPLKGNLADCLKA